MSLIDGTTPDETVEASIQRLIQAIGKAEAEEVWKKRAQGTKLANLPKVCCYQWERKSSGN